MLSKKILYFLFCILFFSVAINLIVKSRTTVAAATTLDVFGGQSAANDPGDWPTVGANAARSSWNSEEVPGQLRPVWYKQFEPYIPRRFRS